MMDDYVALFEKKAEPFFHEKGYQTKYLDGIGFYSWKVDGEVLDIGMCCGDMKKLHAALLEHARAHGCKEMVTRTVRNPRAFMRCAFRCGQDIHLDLKRSGYYPNGRWYWFMTGTVKHDD